MKKYGESMGTDALKDKHFWARVRDDERYAFIINRIKAYYEEAYAPELPHLRFSQRFEYYKSGNRDAMEKEYFRRRKRLSASVILYLLYRESDRLIEIEDLVWAICEEYSWAVPAHTDGTVEGDTTTIDLFVSETAFMLCELLHVCGDALPPVLCDRVGREITARVLDVFDVKRFWWEEGDSNWNAVCTAGVAASYMALRPDGFEKVKSRFLHSMQAFIDGYTDDGTCLEGFGYWHYGFGYYVWFADMLKAFSGGKTDLFRDPKVQRIAAYPFRTFLRGADTLVSFSDGSRQGKADCGLLHYLKKAYPAAVPCVPRARVDVRSGNVGLVHWLRTFLYFDPDAQSQDIALGDYYLKDAAQAIFNRAHYSFAVKAGHNGEQHNHNDVGGFIFCDDDGQALCDLGAGKYTKAYFSDGRYAIFCNGSQGHSVPMFDRQTQKAGKEYGGTLTQNGDVLSVEFAAAYGLQSLTLCRRTVTLREKGVTLCDRFKYTGKEICERFISLRKPTCEAGKVILGKTVLLFGQNYTPRVSCVKQEAHGYAGIVYDVYAIDLIFPAETETFEVEIETV